MPIASGGMAMVWAARMKGTRGFQKIVAVKTMLPKLSEDAQFEQMFLDEAALACQVRHPHVVEIMDLGEQDGVLFLVMEWINGVPLNQIIKSARTVGGVPLPVAVRICIQACAGLHAAHELADQQGQLVGLVHRDVSPQNLLVTYDGVTKVVDFGVAKATAMGGSATQAGQIKGKIAYMAPEQVKGQTIDRRVDVFAMGVVLYALTTGKHPFRKETDAATLYQICSPEPVASPRKIIPGYPIALERVVMQALAKNPARRFPTANDLLRALDQALPASMRISTDDEVAKFVQSLFADKLEQQKATLQAALARADEIGQNSKVKLREFLDSAPPPSLQSASQSGVNETSMLTEARALDAGSGPHTGVSQAGIAAVPVSQATFATGIELAPPPKKKGKGALIAGGVFAALVLVGIAVAMAFSGGDKTAAEASTTKPATPPASAPPTATVAAAPTEAKKEPEPEPATSDSAGEPDEPVAAKKRPRIGSARPAAPPKESGTKPTTTTTPTAKPATTWKHDPGF